MFYVATHKFFSDMSRKILILLVLTALTWNKVIFNLTDFQTYTITSRFDNQEWLCIEF